jgi:ribose/xylose/arabinose/galactoside ABC-type transport system permease subunit
MRRYAVTTYSVMVTAVICYCVYRGFDDWLPRLGVGLALGILIGALSGFAVRVVKVAYRRRRSSKTGW